MSGELPGRLSNAFVSPAKPPSHAGDGDAPRHKRGYSASSDFDRDGLEPARDDPPRKRGTGESDFSIGVSIPGLGKLGISTFRELEQYVNEHSEVSNFSINLGIPGLGGIDFSTLKADPLAVTAGADNFKFNVKIPGIGSVDVKSFREFEQLTRQLKADPKNFDPSAFSIRIAGPGGIGFGVSSLRMQPSGLRTASNFKFHVNVPRLGSIGISSFAQFEQLVRENPDVDKFSISLGIPGVGGIGFSTLKREDAYKSGGSSAFAAPGSGNFSFHVDVPGIGSIGMNSFKEFENFVESAKSDPDKFKFSLGVGGVGIGISTFAPPTAAFDARDFKVDDMHCITQSSDYKHDPTLIGIERTIRAVQTAGLTVGINDATGQPTIWGPSQRRHLTWRPDSQLPAALIACVASAFNQWESACNVKFTRTTEAAFIRVRWATDVEERNAPGVIAAAFFPGEADRSIRLFRAINRVPPIAQTGVLLHEIGHALGFRHEHVWETFTDHPVTNEAPDESGLGAKLLSPQMDKDSVMYYPRLWADIRERRPTELSKLDRLGAALMYGAPGGSSGMVNFVTAEP